MLKPPIHNEDEVYVTPEPSVSVHMKVTSQEQDIPDKSIIKKKHKKYKEASTMEKLFCFMRDEKDQEYDKSGNIIQDFEMRRLRDCRFWNVFAVCINFFALLVIPAVSEGMKTFKIIYWISQVFQMAMVVYSYKNIRIVYLQMLWLQIRNMWPMFDMEGR